MKRLLKNLVKMSKIRENTAKTLVNIEISRSALIYNLNQYKDIAPDHRIAPVLKSNAYGHGISIVANELKDEKIPFFVIDSYFEAKALRSEGIKTPLLIIGYSSIESITKNRIENISFTISNIDTLRDLSLNIKSPTNIHLKIDTGMHRHGIDAEEKDEAIKIIQGNKKIILEGICSHFSDADGNDTRFTDKQIEKWNQLVKYFRANFPLLKYWHISASAGHAFTNAEANMSRLGIGLYGLANIPGIKLKPALEMKTIVTGVRKIKKGETVGYNNTFTATEDMTIATIPVGYNEGVDRRLSNSGFVKVGEKDCKIIGRVSMNITIINISSIKNVKVGDEIVVFSAKRSDSNSIENIAKICSTIVYEIIVHIPPYLRRIVVD